MKKTWIFITAFAICAAVILPDRVSKNVETGVSEDASTQPAMSSEDLELARDIHRLQQLVEDALAWRAKAAAFAQAQAEREKNKQPMTGKDLQLMHEGVSSYLAHRAKIMKLARKYDWLGDDERRITLNVGKGSKNIVAGAEGAILVDPMDIDGRLTIRRIKLSLAASLVLYDNYLFAVNPFQNNDKLRYLVEYDNGSHYKALTEVTKSYLSVKNAKIAQRGILFFELDQRFRAQNPSFLEEQRIQYLEILIRGSFSYERLRDFSGYRRAVEAANLLVKKKGENMMRAFGRQSTNTVSKAFGNSVGMIQSRSGKMKSMSPAEKAEIIKTMRPGDVMLEKTPFRLTDKFIPGHYGHVAIWIGTEADLKKLGVWDHELVRPHKKKISAGHSVLEALRPGVMLNTLDHFLDIDDLAVLRHRQIQNNDAQLRELVLRAFAQVGKEYDFNFDVETDKSIVCSELAYVVYRDENWPTSNSMGRTTISPDHVAAKAIKGGPFDIVMIYYDGAKADVPDLEAFMYGLLQEQYHEIQEMRQVAASARSPGFPTPADQPPQGVQSPGGRGWDE